jgi:hypothetical protein
MIIPRQRILWEKMMDKGRVRTFHRGNINKYEIKSKKYIHVDTW